MITKRQIAAKTPYAPYAMRLILSCVALGDKKTEGWRRNGVKNQYLRRIISICSTLQCVLWGLICRSECFEMLKVTSKSNIQEQRLPFRTFFAFLAIPIKVYAAEIYGGVADCAITQTELSKRWHFPMLRRKPSLVCFCRAVSRETINIFGEIPVSSVCYAQKRRFRAVFYDGSRLLA